MDKIVDLFKGQSFSSEQLENLCNCGDNSNPKSKIIIYSDLPKFNFISELIKPFSCVILLYLTSVNNEKIEGKNTLVRYGHWVFLNKMIDGTLEFFDSYGNGPDEQLKIIRKNTTQKFMNENNQNYPHLMRIITNSVNNGEIKKVIFNDKKLQSVNSDISTCGRWVGLRCVLKEIPLSKFQELFDNKKLIKDLKKQTSLQVSKKSLADWLVTALTLFAG